MANETRWTLDGEPVDLVDLERVNPDVFDPELVSLVDRMQPGEETILGGGAGAEFVLRREA